MHASGGKEDLKIAPALADYAIRHHFQNIENMTKSDTLSVSTDNDDQEVVERLQSSNKYAGNVLNSEDLLD